MNSADDIAKLTYESALAELDALIAKLEQGSIPLDDAIDCYERGSRLAAHCAALLDRVEQRVTQLVVSPSGVRERPADASDDDAAPPPTEPVPALLFPSPPPLRARAVPPVDPDDIPF